MPEAVVGAHTSEIVHQKKTAEGSLTVTYNTNDILANTIGHALAVPTTHTLLWTWDSAFKDPSKELAAELFDRYKDVPWKGDVLVRVGHSSIIGDIQRMMASNDKVRGRPWLLKDPVGRVLEKFGKAGIAILHVLDGAYMIGQAFWSKLTRSDFYNPFSNSLTVYHPKLAIGMHELGHAEYFNNQVTAKGRLGVILARMPLLTIDKVIPFHMPIITPYIEYQATKNAMKHFKTDEERRAGLKMLEGAWATYLFADVLNFMFVPKPLNDAIGLLLAYPASVAGHLMNRLYPKKDQRFGYIFSGKAGSGFAGEGNVGLQHNQPVEKKSVSKKPEVPDLSAHQVLVATARAPKPSAELPIEGKGGRQFSDEPLKNGKRPLHSNTNRITF
jgi:hypothetical protein